MINGLRVDEEVDDSSLHHGQITELDFSLCFNQIAISLLYSLLLFAICFSADEYYEDKDDGERDQQAPLVQQAPCFQLSLLPYHRLFSAASAIEFLL
jgi:hypothetical protein